MYSTLKNLSRSALSILFISTLSHAGVFNLPQFVDYKNWAVGFEPELALTNGSGLSGTAKFTYGITDLSNLQVGIGSGFGDRKFRIGTSYTFDFIPDLENQIGAGIALSGYHYALKGDTSQSELSILPYLHNAFTLPNGKEIDPFFALPVGMILSEGTYKNFYRLVFGANYKSTENVFYTAELGLNGKNIDSYLSFGVTYRN